MLYTVWGLSYTTTIKLANNSVCLYLISFRAAMCLRCVILILGVFLTVAHRHDISSGDANRCAQNPGRKKVKNEYSYLEVILRGQTYYFQLQTKQKKYEVKINEVYIKPETHSMSTTFTTDLWRLTI